MSSVLITVRVNKEEHSAIANAAKNESLSISSFVRSVVIGRIRSRSEESCSEFSHINQFLK